MEPEVGGEGRGSVPQSRHCNNICGWNCSSGPFSLATYSNKPSCSVGPASEFFIEGILDLGLGWP